VSTPFDRPPPRKAGPELLVLQKWEAFLGWLLDHTAKWPKAARFTLTQRVENHALDVLELLVVARYEPGSRRRSLREANLLLERMRHLCRIAKDARVMPRKGFESAMRSVDEAGRMVHGWRQGAGRRRPAGTPA